MPEDLKTLSFRIEEETWQTLKIHCYRKRVTLQKFVTEAIIEKMKKEGVSK